jgi:hypothetical protein
MIYKMKISLLTDAPNHNLALMKLSAWHKRKGDTVILNNQMEKADKTYASILFDWNKNTYIADEYGGIQFPDKILPRAIEYFMPDYTLFNLDYSLGFTFRPCYRHCDFCLVKTLKYPDTRHHSIYEFHNPAFNKICLMNNNTFLDPLWKETFKEIWKEKLIMMEHGMDLRLMDEEKADAIKKTKFDGRIHFAWDRMRDEKFIIRGLEFIKPYKIESRCYVLSGYDTTIEEDLYRCQILINYNQVPYIMPYSDVGLTKDIKNYINSLEWWHTRDNIKQGFLEWQKGIKPEKSKTARDKKAIYEQNLNLFD